MNWHVVSLIALLTIGTVRAINEAELLEYLNGEYESEASRLCYEQNDAEWNFATDVNNKEKEQILTEVTIQNARRRKEIWVEKFKDMVVEANWQEETKRQAKFLKILGVSILEEDQLTQLTKIKNYMTSTYSAAKICPYAKQNCAEKEKLSLEPGIEEVLSKSTDYDELAYVWKAWRRETGEKMRSSYINYVTLSNIAAVANGFKDNGELWRNDYESPNFEADLDALWIAVEPLYTELHTYVKSKLAERYPEHIKKEDTLLPAHVFGNMWAQSWVALEDFVKPFPDASKVNVTAALQADYTVKKMFETSDNFYKSLGLPANNASYGADSMIEKPVGRDVLCHASAWDFCDKNTFRIKMCTNINSEDFITIHHEMGHIQYFLQYKDQPYTFRTGANPGFHEAIGDTIALSVATPKHLKAIGLLGDDYVDNDESNINALMDMALERVAFLPFGLLIDKWRWDVFEGADKKRWNEQWWRMRTKYQKIKPPEERTEYNFDPGAKYHVPGDSQYINYFVAHILEFQLYKALCIKAGEYDPANPDPEKPLHKCDFFNSIEAGTAFSAGLKLGTKSHWKVALKAMTGEETLKADAILEYFSPLMAWLQKQNRKSATKKV